MAVACAEVSVLRFERPSARASRRNELTGISGAIQRTVHCIVKSDGGERKETNRESFDRVIYDYPRSSISRRFNSTLGDSLASEGPPTPHLGPPTYLNNRPLDEGGSSRKEQSAAGTRDRCLLGGPAMRAICACQPESVKLIRSTTRYC